MPATSTQKSIGVEIQPRTLRLPGMDIVRVLAAIAVVWIHTPQSPKLAASTALGRMAVPFFLGASVFLILRSLARELQPARNLSTAKGDHGFIRFAKTRVVRLLFPFAAWSVIYLALKIVKKLVAPNQPNDFPGWEAVFLGTAYHLWFLPFLFVVSLATFLAGSVALKRSCAHTVAIAAAYAGVACAMFPCPFAHQVPDEITFMWLATPGVLWSFSLAIYWVEQPTFVERNRQWLRPLSWTLLTLTTCLLWVVGRNAAAEAVAGISLLVVAVSIVAPFRWAAYLGRLAPLSYGVYLSHLLVLKIGETGFQRIGWEASPARDLIAFGVAVFLSTTLAYLLNGSRRTRWLVG